MILICKVCGKRFEGINRRSEHRDPKCMAVRRRYEPDAEVGVIDLTNGMYAFVSPEDYELVAGYEWSALKSRNTYYAVRTFKDSDGNPKIVSLHRMVMNAQPGQEVDHRDGDGLNCVRKNLRFVTSGQNVANQLARSSSGAKGVYRSKLNGMYYAAVTKDGKTECLGGFRTALKAAEARDERAREVWGEFSTYNVPKRGERRAIKS